MDDAAKSADLADDIELRKARRSARRKMRQAINDAALSSATQPGAQTRGTAARAKTDIARIEPKSLRAPTGDQSGLMQPAAQDDAFEVAHHAREARMQQIRRELRRRRRFRALGILVRFALFVLIPTAIVGWYYFEKATDMYEAESTLVFKSGSAAAASGGGFLSGILGGAGSPQDSVALQEYILSRDILRRLDAEHGWIAHFQSEDIDEIHRLKADATLDDAYSYYTGGWLLGGKVSVSYDIAEGVIRLTVTGATPEGAKTFADAIIGYGEELVNSLNERSRTDGVRAAQENVQDARGALRDAQRQVATVQEQLSIFSVESEAGALQTRIVTLEAEIDEIFAEIEKLKTVTSNQSDSRFVPLRTNLEVKTRQLRDLRQKLTGGGTPNGERPSMAKLSAELELARVDQATSQMMYASALTSLEAAIASAAEQSLYLETVVQPTQPNKATKPDRLQNTGLVFLILFAAYIVGLLTISLIREQAAI
ncbi:MAG: hypothetical protein AAF367_16450 [Pseudomonadota bacterium]